MLGLAKDDAIEIFVREREAGVRLLRWNDAMGTERAGVG